MGYYLAKPLFKKVRKKTEEEQERDSILYHLEMIQDSITKIIMDNIGDYEKDNLKEKMVKSVESIIAEAEELLNKLKTSKTIKPIF